MHFFLVFIYLAVPSPSFGTQDLHCSMWDSFFSCDMWDLSLLPGIEPWPPALGAWSLSHWTTREVLGIFVKIKHIFKKNNVLVGNQKISVLKDSRIQCFNGTLCDTFNGILLSY